VTKLTPIIMHLAHYLPPETAHSWTIRMLRLGISPRYPSFDNTSSLASSVFGIDFKSPVGLAAGFDKSAEAVKSLTRLGAGFIEVGTLTLRPQIGNQRPRVFRLKKDKAIINRYGFNNDGLDKGLERLGNLRKKPGIIGINIGVNKDTADAINDYSESLRRSIPLADYITINVSSPNTPGLRDLQKAKNLDNLLKSLVDIARDAQSNVTAKPLLLKISPDLTTDMIQEIVEIAINRGISGLIVSNTSVVRPLTLESTNKTETGGLSGLPIFELSTIKLAQVFMAAKNRLPIIGVGGIHNPKTAYEKIKAGASLIQIYTALTYAGPGLFSEINKGLSILLKNDNLSNITEAIGIDAEYWASKPE